MNRRYTFMNILRIMALAVIIGYHFLADVYQRGLCEIRHPGDHIVLGNINLVMVAVSIFFILSGCGLVLMMRRREESEGFAGAHGRSVPADTAGMHVRTASDGITGIRSKSVPVENTAVKSKPIHEELADAYGKSASEKIACAHSRPASTEAAAVSGDKSKWKEYYTGRFFKILVPFYITYIAYLVYKLISADAPLFEGIAWWKAIFTVMGIDEYLSMAGIPTCSLGIGEWFLGALIMMYAVFPLLYTAMKKWKWQTIAAAAVYYAVVILTYRSDIAWYNNVFVKIFDFILGMFLAFEFEDLKRIGRARFSPAILPALLVVTAACALIRMDPAFSNILVCAGIFLMGYFIEEAVGDIPLISRLFAVLCGFEYYVFLVHHCVIYLYQEPMQQARMIISKPRLVMLFAIELATMILLAAAVRWIAGRLKPACGKVQGSHKHPSVAANQDA